MKKMKENSSAAGNPQNPPNHIPIEKVQEIVLAAENRAHFGSVLINILERFREDLTPTEQGAMVGQIQSYYPWYGQQMREPPRQDGGNPPSGAISKDSKTPSLSDSLEEVKEDGSLETEDDVSDEEFAEVCPHSQHPKHPVCPVNAAAED